MTDPADRIANNYAMFMVKGYALECLLPGTNHGVPVFCMGGSQVVVVSSRRALRYSKDATGLCLQPHRVINDVVHPTAEIADSLRTTQFCLPRLQVLHVPGEFATRLA